MNEMNDVTKAAWSSNPGYTWSSQPKGWRRTDIATLYATTFPRRAFPMILKSCSSVPKVDPFRLSTSVFDHTDILMRRPRTPGLLRKGGRSEPCLRTLASSQMPLPAGGSRSLNNIFSFAGRSMGATFTATSMLPPLHQHGVETDSVKTTKSPQDIIQERQQRVENMKRAQEQDRRHQAAIQEEKQKEIGPNEQFNLQPARKNQSKHIFSEVYEWRRYVPPFFHLDDVNVGHPLSALRIADAAAFPRKTPPVVKNDDVESDQEEYFTDAEEELMINVVNEYARLFMTSEDVENWRLSRPSFCRLLFDCDVVSLSETEDKLDVRRACDEFDKISENNPVLPRASVRTVEVPKLLRSLLTNPEAKEDFFKEGIVRALNRVAKMHEKLNERAETERNQDVAMREKVGTKPPVQWPPPCGVTMSDWSKAVKKPPNAPEDSLYLELQRVRNELICRHQFCEPETLLFSAQFGALFQRLFDLYCDFNTKHLSIQTGHMSFPSFLRFCMDFGLFPDLISYGDLCELYNKVDGAEYVEMSKEDLARSAKEKIGTVKRLPRSSCVNEAVQKSPEKKGKKSVLEEKPSTVSMLEAKVKEECEETESVNPVEALKLASLEKPVGRMTALEVSVYRLLSHIEQWLYNRMGSVQDIFIRFDDDVDAKLTMDEFQQVLGVISPPIDCDEERVKEIFLMIDLDGNGEISVEELDKVIKTVRNVRCQSSVTRGKQGKVRRNRAEDFMTLSGADFYPSVFKGHYRIFGASAFFEALMMVAFLRLQKGNIAQVSCPLYHKVLWLPTYLFSKFKTQSKEQTSDSGYLTPFQQVIEDWWSQITLGPETGTVQCDQCKRAPLKQWGTVNCACASAVSIESSLLRNVVCLPVLPTDPEKEEEIVRPESRAKSNRPSSNSSRANRPASKSNSRPSTHPKSSPRSTPGTKT